MLGTMICKTVLKLFSESERNFNEGGMVAVEFFFWLGGGGGMVSTIVCV